MTYPLFSNKKLIKFDNKLIFKSFLLLFVLVIPFNIIHETGHAIPCLLEGKEFKMNIGIMGSSLQCLGNVENKLEFRASGGLLAFLTAAIPYAIFRKKFDKQPYISIVLLSMSIAQLANMFVETFLFENYITNGFLSMIIINIVQYGSFIYLVFHFGKRRIENVKPNNY